MGFCCQHEASQAAQSLKGISFRPGSDQRAVP
jgi:hypothetical protein